MEGLGYGTAASHMIRMTAKPDTTPELEGVMSTSFLFPDYTNREKWVDGVIHLLGVASAITGTVFLLIAVIVEGRAAGIVGGAIYAFGLLATFGFSASYNLFSINWVRGKEILRRLDHAAIYLMIAGTYTPFALVSLGGAVGITLLSIVWTVAGIGIALKLMKPRQYERTAIALYIALGWIGLPLIGLLVMVLPLEALIMLGLGGLFYTAGVPIHLWRGLPYHNAVWHAFVLAAAACHYFAVYWALTAA